MNQLLRFCLICLTVTQWGMAQNNQPNILIITLDDMNWDSAGIYGNTIPEITPNIDQLGWEGLVFEYGYVQASNCSPSRGVIMSGMYPHQSGVRGFLLCETQSKNIARNIKG
jgi:arylsulfatase A-like enzyme